MEKGQDIDITPNGSRPSARGPAHNFTGSVVIDPLFDASKYAHATGGLVTFAGCWPGNPGFRSRPASPGAASGIADDSHRFRECAGDSEHHALLVGSAHADRAGTASGVLNTCRQLGAALAVAVFGALVAHPESFIQGMELSLVIATVLLLATTAASLRLHGRGAHE